jgi:butyryl-CoA dehydrogenase
LLDTLTPVIKSWPSEFGPQANSLAIQVLGGHGYINEHPVEMFYRDNRLNAIHEGTTGIQAIDLLGRKVPMAEMAGYRAVLEEMSSSCHTAMECEQLATYAEQLRVAMQRLERTTTILLDAMKSRAADQVLANASHYLDAFGHVVIAWMWLRQGIIAGTALAADPHPDDESFYRGKLQALRYFYNYELTRVHGWCELLSAVDLTCYDMQVEWF